MSIILVLRKEWKTTIISVVIGGTVGGLLYLLFRSYKKSKNSDAISEIVQNADFSLALQDIQSASHRKCLHSRSLKSFYSRTSGLSDKRKTLSSHAPCDFDLEESSIVCCDIRILGLETLTGVVEHLESLMSKVSRVEERSTIKQSSETENLINDLRQLLESAYGLVGQYKQNLVINEYDYLGSCESLSSQDDSCSFFSTSEQLDLTDLELLIRFNLSKPLYCNSLKMVDRGEIAYRALRTQFVGCEQDVEYLAKMHCLRQAFTYIFSRPEATNWIVSIGERTIFRLLHCLGYPNNDFKEAYDRLVEFVQLQCDDPNSDMTNELLMKGLKSANFYDVVFDYFLLEAFEVLANPPSTVISVTRHRWLSDNFKRCALDSTIWTILLAKRKLLKFPDGYFAHHYSVVGTLAPALAWGFLGPDEKLFEVCDRFRLVVIEFIRDMFTSQNLAGLAHINHSFVSTANGSLVEGDFGDLTTVKCSTDDDESETSTTVAEGHEVAKVDDCRQVGLRYSTLNELASDLYVLFDVYSKRLTNMLVREAIQMDNPMDEELQFNPLQPKL